VGCLGIAGASILYAIAHDIYAFWGSHLCRCLTLMHEQFCYTRTTYKTPGSQRKEIEVSTGGTACPDPFTLPGVLKTASVLSTPPLLGSSTHPKQSEQLTTYYPRTYAHSTAHKQPPSGARPWMARVHFDTRTTGGSEAVTFLPAI
jgi:hypothetical protein